MSASAILNILVGLAIGGWLVWGGLAGKIADELGIGMDVGSGKVNANLVEQPVAAGAGLVMV